MSYSDLLVLISISSNVNQLVGLYKIDVNQSETALKIHVKNFMFKLNNPVQAKQYALSHFLIDFCNLQCRYLSLIIVKNYHHHHHHHHKRCPDQLIFHHQINLTSMQFKIVILRRMLITVTVIKAVGIVNASIIVVAPT